MSVILSMLSLLVSAGSLCVAYLAWRRTGVYLRLRLRQNARELGVLLDGAITMLASARRSHLRVLAMEGLAQSDNAQIFEQETAADDVELRQLRDKARVEFREFDLRITDSELETKLVDAHGMRKRVEQIRDKYLAVLAQDDLKRAARQREVGDRGNRSRP